MTAPTTAAGKLSMALSTIYVRCPFDASFLHSMSLTIVPAGHEVTTAATDCDKHVWVNAAFAETLDYRSLAFVLCHEARHKVFAHAQRRADSGRIPTVSNMAADYVINNGLIAEGHVHSFTPLSLHALGDILEGVWVEQSGDNRVLADPNIDPAWGVREIYDYLMSRVPPPEKGGGRGGRGGGGEGGVSYPEGAVMANDSRPSDRPYTAEEAAQAQLDVLAAYAAAKAQGMLPKGMYRIIGELESSRTDWRERLHAFAATSEGSGEFATDWTYRRLSRRYTGTGPLIPSVSKPPTGEIAVVIDTSGSIGEAELGVIAAEVRKLHQDARPEKLHIIWCDASVAGTQEFGPDETLDLQAKGGGGTAFEPAFEWIAAHVERPMCVVYFTDGYGEFNFTPCVECPVLWAVTTDVAPPWGERVKVDLT
jgi:predicted metal-dependent peptidase